MAPQAALARLLFLWKVESLADPHAHSRLVSEYNFLRGVFGNAIILFLLFFSPEKQFVMGRLGGLL